MKLLKRLQIILFYPGYRRPVMIGALVTLFLIVFHPELAFSARNIIDDQCYLEWLHRLVFLPYGQCSTLYHYPGVALVWLPGALVSLVASKLGVGDFEHWLLVTIGITAFACFAASVFVLARIITKYGSEVFPSGGLWPILFLLGTPVLHFATVRTTMAHSPELLLAMLTVWFLLEKRFVPAIGTATLLAFTRINDFPILFVVLAGVISYQFKKWNLLSRRQKNRVILGWSLCGLAVLPFAIRIVFFGYNGDSLSLYFKLIKFSDPPRVFIGDQWGLVFTAGTWVLALFLGARHFFTLSFAAKIGYAWMWIQLLVIWGGDGMGNSFGYRYLIGTYAAALLILLESPTLKTAHWKKALKILIACQAIWVTHLCWVYDHYSSAWEVIRDVRGWNILKQLAHPVMRLQHSVVGVMVRQSLDQQPITNQFGAALSFEAIVATFVLLIAALTVLRAWVAWLKRELWHQKTVESV